MSLQLSLAAGAYTAAVSATQAEAISAAFSAAEPRTLARAATHTLVTLPADPGVKDAFLGVQKKDDTCFSRCTERQDMYEMCVAQGIGPLCGSCIAGCYPGASNVFSTTSAMKIPHSMPHSSSQTNNSSLPISLLVNVGRPSKSTLPQHHSMLCDCFHGKQREGTRALCSFELCPRCQNLG